MTAPGVAADTDRPDPPQTVRATSTGPTGRALWQRARGPLIALLVLLLASVGYAALRSTRSAGTLDPRSYAPDGARAAATLLSGRGVQVQVVGDLPALQAAVQGAAGTVLVPEPADLTDDELGQLGRLRAPVVVVGAGAAQLGALGVPVSAEAVDVVVRRPACELAAATAAGTALTGGEAYLAEPGIDSVGCYATGGQATVLTLPGRGLTLVGAPDPLTNDRLGQDGNAALTLGLLGGARRVLWLLPDPGRALPSGQRSVRDLLPAGVLLGALQLVVAVVLLALWRARRLGRVVAEPLPVVVRAAEAVEARGRLYRAAGARGTAAGALRAGARDRLARRLGLPPEPDRTALVVTLAERLGRDPQEVDALLYGAPPADDAALVRLAGALDRLSP